MKLTLSEQLNQPFEYNRYGVNYEGVVYVSQQSVVDRLNEVIGFENWEHKPLEIDVNMEIYSVSVLAEIKVYNDKTNRWITRTQYGNKPMTIQKGETVPRAQAIEDAKKSAMSDSMKKCASWFGVASDVYNRKLKAIKPHKSDGSNNLIYNKLLSKFNLNAFDYKNGIVILPDSYKGFYEEQDWFGIFESDLKNVLSSGGNDNSNSGGNSQPNSNGNKNSGKNQNSSKNGNRQGQSTNDNGQSNPNTSTSNKGTGGTSKPLPFRIKVLSAPKQNPDGSLIFDALLESSENCAVIVPKELSNKANNLISPDNIVKVSGWLNQNTSTLKLAKQGKFELDQSQKAS